MRERWALYLCRCDGTLPLEAERFETLAPLSRVVDGHGVAAADFASAFAAEAKDQGATRVLVGCSQSVEALEAAFSEVGWLPDFHPLDLKTTCFLSHANAPKGANEKALRLIRGEMRSVGRSEDVAENPLAVEGRTLLVTDDPAGLALATSLEGASGEGSPLVVVFEGDDASWEDAAREDVDTRNLNRGHLTEVTGRLGKLTAHIEGQGGRGGNGARAVEPTRVEAAQIVVARAGGFDGLQARTGLHRVDMTDAIALAGIPETVAGLTGTFMKPEHVRYDREICAGGAAGHEACGRCITMCPYDAVARMEANPLRVVVDHLTCEGCGGCTAACPTGALAFTDPTPAQLYDRLAGMLAPPRGGAEGGLGGADASSHMEPTAQVAVFHCPEQGRSALDRAAEHPWQDGTGLLPVEVPCLRHVSPAMMLAALRLGAAGVALLGCEDCVHGERDQLAEDLELIGRILDAFGLEAGRVRMFTTEGTIRDSEGYDEALGALERFAEEMTPTGLVFEGRSYRGGGNREVMAEALSAIIEHTGREPGGLTLKGSQPFAWAEVNDEKCTLCRSCANVCPSHAFRYDINENVLTFKHIDCVACGLCEQVCPENVITLRRELYLEKDAMIAQVVVEDETLNCTKCEKPYINRRALDAVEGRVLGLETLLDTFQGSRKDILRMCPDCRGVAAVFEVEKGWEP